MSAVGKEYGDGLVRADRHPENQLAAVLGPEGLDPVATNMRPFSAGA